MRDTTTTEKHHQTWPAGLHCRRSHAVDLDIDYAVKNWFRRGEVSVLYGPSNVGKSALVCHLGHCITTGERFFGARVRSGMFLHVAAESPGSILDRTSTYPVLPGEFPYLVKDQAVDLSDPAAVGDFIDLVAVISTDADQPITMIAIDTLAESIGDNDENNSAAMGGIARAARRIASTIGAHVMLVHHSGKDVERGARGSTALRGAVDTELRLSTGDDGVIVVTQDKQRTMRRSSPVQFRLDQVILGQDSDGDNRTIVRVLETQAPASPPPKQKNTGVRALDIALMTVLHNRQRSSNPLHRAFTTVEIFDALPPEVFTATTRESRLKAVNRALLVLADQKNPAITGESGKWKVREDSKSVPTEDPA